MMANGKSKMDAKEKNTRPPWGSQLPYVPGKKRFRSVGLKTLR
jgi:hypothetical protein